MLDKARDKLGDVQGEFGTTEIAAMFGTASFLLAAGTPVGVWFLWSLIEDEAMRMSAGPPFTFTGLVLFLGFAAGAFVCALVALDDKEHKE